MTETVPARKKNRYDFQKYKTSMVTHFGKDKVTLVLNDHPHFKVFSSPSIHILDENSFPLKIVVKGVIFKNRGI